MRAESNTKCWFEGFFWPLSLTKNVLGSSEPPHLLPDPKCADQPQQHFAQGRICHWRVVGFTWGGGGNHMPEGPAGQEPRHGTGGTLPAARPAAGTQH